MYATVGAIHMPDSPGGRRYSNQHMQRISSPDQPANVWNGRETSKNLETSPGRNGVKNPPSHVRSSRGKGALLELLAGHTPANPASVSVKIVGEFVPQSPTELPATIGQWMTILYELKGWAFTRDLHGAVGYVPLDFCRLRQEPSKAASNNVRISPVRRASSSAFRTPVQKDRARVGSSGECDKKGQAIVSNTLYRIETQNVPPNCHPLSPRKDSLQKQMKPSGSSHYPIVTANSYSDAKVTSLAVTRAVQTETSPSTVANKDKILHSNGSGAFKVRLTKSISRQSPEYRAYQQLTSPVVTRAIQTDTPPIGESGPLGIVPTRKVSVNDNKARTCCDCENQQQADIDYKALLDENFEFVSQKIKDNLHLLHPLSSEFNDEEVEHITSVAETRTCAEQQQHVSSVSEVQSPTDFSAPRTNKIDSPRSPVSMRKEILAIDGLCLPTNDPPAIVSVTITGSTPVRRSFTSTPVNDSDSVSEMIPQNSSFVEEESALSGDESIGNSDNFSDIIPLNNDAPDSRESEGGTPCVGNDLSRRVSMDTRSEHQPQPDVPGEDGSTSDSLKTQTENPGDGIHQTNTNCKDSSTEECSGEETEKELSSSSSDDERVLSPVSISDDGFIEKVYAPKKRISQVGLVITENKF